MKKRIKLTESDLIRIIQKVIKEQEIDRELGNQPSDFVVDGILGHNNFWYNKFDHSVNPKDFDYDDEFVFGPDDYEDYYAFTETHFPGNRWSFNKRGGIFNSNAGEIYYNRYQQDGPIILRVKYL